MRLVPLNKIFSIQYGNQFDLNKLDDSIGGDINFVSRSSRNLGVVAKVSQFKEVEPFEAGLITVTLGGTYLLSSFVQQAPFYTAQNVKVLTPLREMSFAEKIFYCKVIESNRFRYTSHGREANATLDFLLVPEDIPKEFSKFKLTVLNTDSVGKAHKPLDISRWKTFKYGGTNGIFEIKNGYYNKKPDQTEIGDVPFIGATIYNNGVTGYFSVFDIENTQKSEGSSPHDLSQKIFRGNCITVSNNGTDVGNAFYQEKDFTCSHDVNVLYLKRREWNKYIAIFICTLIQLEKYRWAYGRKWRPSRMPLSEIRLPVDKDGNPDFDFMEEYVKSLPYSKSL